MSLEPHGLSDVQSHLGSEGCCLVHCLVAHVTHTLLECLYRMRSARGVAL